MVKFSVLNSHFSPFLPVNNRHHVVLRFSKWHLQLNVSNLITMLAIFVVYSGKVQMAIQKPSAKLYLSKAR